MIKIKERPILFSALMIQAILEGRKTQTRRPVKLTEFGRSDTPGYDWTFRDRHLRWQDYRHARFVERRCPYGRPGDKLWVREAWYPAFKREKDLNGCVYRADDDGISLNPGWSPNGKGGGWKSSIHMPRWASRITLEIVNVRVERLQDINDAEATAEGVVNVEGGFSMDRKATPEDALPTARAAFGNYINRVSGGPNWNQWFNDETKPKPAWERNEWHWVISFKRLPQWNVSASK